MANLFKMDKEDLIIYLKIKDMILLNYNGVIIEPDEIDSDAIIDLHA